MKKRYRKLVAANHPDKLLARGLPEEFIKIATTQNRRDQCRLRDDRAWAEDAGMSGFSPDHAGRGGPRVAEFRSARAAFPAPT